MYSLHVVRSFPHMHEVMVTRFYNFLYCANATSVIVGTTRCAVEMYKCLATIYAWQDVCVNSSANALSAHLAVLFTLAWITYSTGYEFI